MTSFISAEIDVWFDSEPVLKKRTGMPSGFVWEGERFPIVELLAEWHEYDKRRELGNTRRSQVQLTAKRGSWGLGRDYYRVRTDSQRVFELYYDRRPRSREVIGSWVLLRELDEFDLLIP